jgi:hypothetical protein
MNDPVPTLTTTRTGGRSARFIAVAVALVLGTVVYVGVTGQHGPLPPVEPNPSDVALVPTLSPSPQSSPLDHVVAVRADPTAPNLYQYLGTGLTIEGHGTLAVMDGVGPDQYRASYQIPYEQIPSRAHLEFDSVSSAVSHDDLDRLGAWDFVINSVGPGGGPRVIVLDTGGGPMGKSLSNPDFNRISTNGYRISAALEGRQDAALMTIDVTVGPDMYFPSESYGLRFGPDGSSTTAQFETFAAGGFDATETIPRSLYGTTIPVTLKAGSADVVTIQLKVPAAPTNLNLDRVEHTGEPEPGATGVPGIVVNGYFLVVGEHVMGDHLDLIAELSVLSTPLPSPSR